MTTTLPSAGLTDPVHDSQRIFRKILQAMARPGLPRALSAEAQPPGPMSATIAAVAITLFDSGVSVWLDAYHDNTATRSYLELHTGVRVVDRLEEADYAIANGAASIPFERLRPVDPRTPHTGTTVILHVNSLRQGDRVRLTGPGIRSDISLLVDGLSPDFWADRHHRQNEFPQGVDFILADHLSICGLPRTTRSA
ncbi:phosphonate C-P lyase system protein PhnH [Rhizobium miluonense]|uniref:Alpha-D-ribose 1-methylphosphonate 5-triphosphate synthase subunit PhnH n=1 Tax=Rhizobium miluonense TaxID=411945 RepID=A0A1C3WDE8_9HYPH|nr:phosphonate C-P lyase system protein PhnH [Rhizobium miluonense]SCB37983.1 alpha-D-ribose 1-methylphosphonate 5-triphosphate synthase subunit PhnH [Rhizobium miluonense]